MGQALYRKYRSKSLEEVVGQEHITTTLEHALKTGKMAHAYLFTGPRGTGKTSIARILAHKINDLPYTDDTHLDIIEIDAASNRRIDEIRDLRDKVNVAPTSAKYKVYIIDEVHMLTREAFNALLKTLEEPPAHVVFILATTESHKLPETIVSRTQRFMFKPVPLDKVIAHLRTIATAEGLDIDDEALSLVAAYGDGSFRDSISLLDQTRGQDGKVDADFVRSLIGIPTDEAVEELLTSIRQHDAGKLVGTLAALHEQGFGASQIAKQLSGRLRHDAIERQADSTVFNLLERLLEVPAAHDPESFLQITLLGHALAGQLTSPVQTIPPPQPVPAAMPTKQTIPTTVTPSTASSAPVGRPKKSAVTPTSVSIPNDTTMPAAKETPSSSSEPATVDAQVWPEILNTLKKTHNTLYGIARMARPEFRDDMVVLHFSFAFHKKRLSEAKNQDVIVDVIRKVTGKTIGLRCELEAKKVDTPAPTIATTATPEAAPPSAATATKPSSETLAAISNVFGGAEVLDA